MTRDQRRAEAIVAVRHALGIVAAELDRALFDTSEQPTDALARLADHYLAAADGARSLTPYLEAETTPEPTP